MTEENTAVVLILILALSNNIDMQDSYNILSQVSFNLFYTMKMSQVNSTLIFMHNTTVSHKSFLYIIATKHPCCFSNDDYQYSLDTL